MNNRLGFSSFILALGLYSLRVEKKGFLSLVDWVTDSGDADLICVLPAHQTWHTFLDIWRDWHGGCSSRSQQSLTHNLKLICLAGQIKPVASDACPANTDLTQITAQPCSSSQFRWPLGMESSPWSLLTAQLLHLAIPLLSLQLPYGVADLSIVFLLRGGYLLLSELGVTLLSSS